MLIRHGDVMKDFWSEHSKIIGKTILNQFGAAFFGIMLFFAAYSLKHIVWLPLLASIMAIAFYLYLIYMIMWEYGGQARIKFDGGRGPKKLANGLFISLISNIPNLVLAAVILVSEPFINSSDSVAGVVNTVGRAVALLWEGMYMGVVKTFAPHNPLIYLLMVFPALAVSTFAYYIGFSNRKLFGLIKKN